LSLAVKRDPLLRVRQGERCGVETRWDGLAASLAERFPKAAALMHGAKEDMLAFRYFPKGHLRKIWSTNLLERDNQESRRSLLRRSSAAPGLWASSPATR
jgi:transposase-like protein